MSLSHPERRVCLGDTRRVDPPPTALGQGDSHVGRGSARFGTRPGDGYVAESCRIPIRNGRQLPGRPCRYRCRTALAAEETRGAVTGRSSAERPAKDALQTLAGTVRIAQPWTLILALRYDH